MSIKVKVIGGLADEVEEFSAGVSGQSILLELRQGRAGRLRNSAGRTITKDDKDLPAGDYTFEVVHHVCPGPGQGASGSAEGFVALTPFMEEQLTGVILSAFRQLRAEKDNVRKEASYDHHILGF